jgi:predicted nuclease with TOPRIM domain
MEKHWKTKKQMRDRIEELKRYNDYLRDEVATQHGKYLATKKQSELLYTRIDLAQKKLFKKVHESRRDDDASIFAIGWNQAIGHVEAMIIELLGVDDKAAYEEFGI